jgi:DNA-directed RNA polymerase specialized sigma subunit
MQQTLCHHEQSAHLNHLRRLLTQFEAKTLNHEEIAYLQLFYMEGLSEEDISKLLECELSDILRIKRRFAL